jgi:hypothetical protein
VTPVETISPASERQGLVAPRTWRQRLWRHRWLFVWALGVVSFIVFVGVPTTRPHIFAIVGLGLVASGSDTKGNWKRVVIDFVPFWFVLTLYDALRSQANKLFIPHTLPQIHFDEWVFGGTVPTVALQHALYTPGTAHVWDYAAFCVYMTHFVVPFVIAGVLWKRNHDRFRRYTALFIGLTFAGYFTYVLWPATPPWLASQDAHLAPTATIIDEMWTHIGIANGASVFSATGHFANPVAAMPSLHSAYPVLIVLFFWKSAGRWRPLLLLYPIAMAFTLVYTGEHYVIDIVFGWIYASGIFVGGNRLLDAWEQRRLRGAVLRAAPAAA